MFRRICVGLISLFAFTANLGAQEASTKSSTSDSDTTMLNEIVVTDKKVQVRHDGMNFIVSNIQGSTLADAGSMLDMMAWVPGLSLDAADNIRVFGISGSPLVYINGVKVTDMKKLTSLPSNMVKKIEVIRAPGAEYPAGTGSVLRITTAVPLKDIVNGTLVERANQRHRYSNSITTSAFGSFGKFDFLASAGYNIGNIRQSSTATESIFAKDGSLLRDVSTFQKDLVHTSRWTWLAGATYHPSENDEISIEYSGNTASRSRDFVSELTTVAAGSIADLTHYDSRNSSAPVNNTLLANYAHEFARSRLNIAATYNHKRSDNNEGIYLMPENILSETNLDRTSYSMWTLQGDYSWKFLKKDRQSIGLYGGRADNKSNADYTSMGRQDVSGSVSWGEFYYSSYWEFSGYGITPGVRVRYERQDSKSLIDGNASSFGKTYFNVVPQLSIYHRFSKKLAMNLYYKYGYSLPSFSELSPAVTLSDLIYYRTGNPDLKVPRRHNVALVFNLPAFNIVAEYTSLRNKIVEITTPVENSEYFIERPVNMAGNYYLTLTASYSLNAANKFRLYASALVRRTHTEYYYLDRIQKKNKFFTMLSLNADYSILHNLGVFAAVNYASPQLVDNMDVGHTCDISFGGNLRLLQSRLSLRLAVNDILARSVTPYWSAYSPNLYRTRRNRYDTRGVTLTVTYRFTLAKKKYYELDNADDYDRM